MQNKQNKPHPNNINIYYKHQITTKLKTKLNKKNA